MKVVGDRGNFSILNTALMTLSVGHEYTVEEVLFYF